VRVEPGLDAWTWVRWQPPFGPLPAGPQGLAGRVRAVQEAAAYSARRSAGLLTGLLGVRFAEAVLTGGAGRSQLWPQILADVLGITVRVPEAAESAAIGAAAMAASAIGLATDPGERACRGAAWAAHPDPARRRAYDLLYAQWQSGPGPAGGQAR
jgi:sugar (pentulose or hexulose) kinase